MMKNIVCLYIVTVITMTRLNMTRFSITITPVHANFSLYWSYSLRLHSWLRFKSTYTISRNPHVLGNSSEKLCIIMYCEQIFPFFVFFLKWMGRHKPQTFTPWKGESVCGVVFKHSPRRASTVSPFLVQNLKELKRVSKRSSNSE